LIQSAAAIPTWKTIQVGNVANRSAFLAALDAADCGVGDAVQDIFVRPEFTVSALKAELDLVLVSVAELGVTIDRPPLARIYGRALRLGLALAPPETGPQLRLQYFDQPLGEFLNLGMDPISGRNGEMDIFVVANGGAGLLLLSQDASARMQFFLSSQFVFVRQTNVKAAQK